MSSLLRLIGDGLVGLAVRRLPARLGAAEKRRWEEEMRADVAAVPGRPRRLLVAYRIWRKGTARMPTDVELEVRPADTKATSEPRAPAQRSEALEEFTRRIKEAPDAPPSEWAP